MQESIEYMARRLYQTSLPTKVVAAIIEAEGRARAAHVAAQAVRDATEANIKAKGLD